jgi:hypothetical protein
MSYDMRLVWSSVIGGEEVRMVLAQQGQIETVSVDGRAEGTEKKTNLELYAYAC